MFIFTADSHLKYRLWRRLPDINNDAFLAFEQIVQFAKERAVTAIILGGDIFDPPNSDSLKKYELILASYSGEVYGIDGEHDKANPAWLEVPGIRGEPIHKKLIEIDDHSIFALRHLPITQLQNELKEVPSTADTLILHQLVKGVLPSWNFLPEWVPENIKLALLGHLHARYNFDIPGGKAYYVGSTVAQAIDEFSEFHGFITVDGDEVEYVPLKTRLMKRLSLLEEAELAQITETLENLDIAGYLELTPLIVIEYSPTIANVQAELNRLQRTFSDYAFDCRPLTSHDQQATTTDVGVFMEDFIAGFTDDPQVQALLVGLLQLDPTILDKFRSYYLDEENGEV